VLTDYASRDTARPTGPVVLETTSRQPLLQYSLVEGNSTIPLSARTSRLQYDTTTHENGVLRYVGEVSGHRIDVSYTSPKSDSGRYVTRVQVHIDGVSTGAQLAVRLPSTLASMETDTADDIRHLAYGYRTASGDVSSVAFGKLDTASTRVTTGPLEWVALRNKYFLVAVVTLDSAISKASFRGEPHAGKLVPMAEGTIQLPLRDGRANFELYTGPQEFERLRAIGHGLDQVNPYAGWLHAVVQPFATAVTWVLLWMKRASGLSYGWVIIIFGILIRVILWPLYQSSMRTSIRMQRLQPELAEVQKKYKQDPRKQQEALVKLYQAHGMTPFSPMMGCLPMLLPMPILFALYFVFLNTIEFRGVSFLWMHDISAADPYYITPLVMGLSMFVLSWIGMRGTPPTTQTRMMSYMMPVVLTFMFFRFAAGLNLYYAVQNIAAIPQQWLLAQERAGAAAGGSGGGTRGRSKT
jgi:YidC/Oxa1 family membrane protein insertase